MTTFIPERYLFETGVYRPPSEGGSHSLLVRFTRNCPWNRCTFCGMYKTEKFQIRSAADIMRDIDAMAALRDDLVALSRDLGRGDEVTHPAAIALLEKYPALADHPGFGMLYHWLVSGAKTAFLQDADSLIMKTDPLVAGLSHLRRTFGAIERVTTYARAKTVLNKSPGELETIRHSGLDRLHVGLESGDDAVLKQVAKGATADIHVRAGRKALAAGFQLSEYWMPGLGGKARWRQHARNTARVVNRINPHYLRSRPFRAWPGTPIANALQNQTFLTLTPTEQLRELRLTIESLSFTGRVCFDHAGNYWKDRRGRHLFSFSYEGYRFPEQKQTVLALIDEGLQR